MPAFHHFESAPHGDQEKPMKTTIRGSLTIASTALLIACTAHQPVSDSSGPSAPRSVSQPTKRDARLEEATQEEVIVTGSYVKPNSREKGSAYRKMENRQAGAAPLASVAMICCQANRPLVDREQYQHQDDNPVQLAAEHPVSTFSIDVDTGAYANVRRFLNAGQLPPQDAVRVEEMINYFDYRYEPPTSRTTPFAVATELAAAPWNRDAWLLKIGIKGFQIAASERPAANLVFLIDVSGSMNSPDKLPLLKSAFRLLTDQLPWWSTPAVPV
jgi:Ca-activated chloride channel homolog